MKKLLYMMAGVHWQEFGLRVIPIWPGNKKSAVKWGPWEGGASADQIKRYWSRYPSHEIGAIVGEGLVVFDADGPEAVKTLKIVAESHGVEPSLIVKTGRGEHWYFRLQPGVCVKQDSHDSTKYPERVDIKTGRSLIILPPSTGKSIIRCDVSHVDELAAIGQQFVDSIYLMNDQQPPRPPEPIQPHVYSSGSTSLKLVVALLQWIDPDSGYDAWLRVLMAIFYETKGGAQGLEIADKWSSQGRKYRCRREIERKWQSFNLDHPYPVKIGTLIRLAQDAGADIDEIRMSLEPGFEVIDDEGGAA